MPKFSGPHEEVNVGCGEAEGTCAEVVEAAVSLLQFYKLFSADDANGNSKSDFESNGIRDALKLLLTRRLKLKHTPCRIPTEFTPKFLW